MEIKIGDIVEYKGQPCRVITKQSSVTHPTRFELAVVCDEFIRKIDSNHVLLIESVDVPELTVGDLVYINDVPKCERRRYESLWVPEMDEYIGNWYQVTDTADNYEFGPIVKLGDWWFQTYHLDPTGDYDIV